MRDHITASERLDFTTTGTRPYRGMPIEQQRQRYEQMRQAALAELGDRWLLHPSHGPQRSTPLDLDDFEPDEPDDEFDDRPLTIGGRFHEYEVTPSEYYRYHYDPEPRG